MFKETEAARRTMLESKLTAAGAPGPYGLLKFTEARSGDGFVVDGLPYLIEEILADPTGMVERVLVAGPNKLPFWLDPGNFSLVSCPANTGTAALFVARIPHRSSQVDFIALAPTTTVLRRYVHGKPFSGVMVRRSIFLNRCGSFDKAA